MLEPVGGNTWVSSSLGDNDIKQLDVVGNHDFFACEGDW